MEILNEAVIPLFAMCGGFVIMILMVLKISDVVQSGQKLRAGTAPGGLAGELQAIREEMRQLRQQNTDLMLALDASLEHVDRRMQHMENRVSLDGDSATHYLSGTGTAGTAVEQRVGRSG
jgi:hypothetical protein